MIHISKHTTNPSTLLSAYWENGIRGNVMDANMSAATKWSTEQLEYPAKKGIFVCNINTHSYHIGGENALHLHGYTDCEIQKMGRWRSDMFKTYISDQLIIFSKGMSKNMKTVLNYINIEGGVMHDITGWVLSDTAMQVSVKEKNPSLSQKPLENITSALQNALS
jgi:hypothetical protein